MTDPISSKPPVYGDTLLLVLVGSTDIKLAVGAQDPAGGDAPAIVGLAEIRRPDSRRFHEHLPLAPSNCERLAEHECRGPAGATQNGEEHEAP